MENKTNYYLKNNVSRETLDQLGFTYNHGEWVLKTAMRETNGGTLVANIYLVIDESTRLITIENEMIINAPQDTVIGGESYTKTSNLEDATLVNQTMGNDLFKLFEMDLVETKPDLDSLFTELLKHNITRAWAYRVSANFTTLKNDRESAEYYDEMGANEYHKMVDLMPKNWLGLYDTRFIDFLTSLPLTQNKDFRKLVDIIDHETKEYKELHDKLVAYYLPIVKQVAKLVNYEIMGE